MGIIGKTQGVNASNKPIPKKNAMATHALPPDSMPAIWSVSDRSALAAASNVVFAFACVADVFVSVVVTGAACLACDRKSETAAFVGLLFVWLVDSAFIFFCGG